MRYTEMVSLSDFDQQQQQQQTGAVSTINNKHYQFHSDYDENIFAESDSGDAMQSALNRGPYFDVSVSRNVTALVATTAYLNCRVRNLSNKTVTFYSITTPHKLLYHVHADDLWLLHCRLVG